MAMAVLSWILAIPLLGGMTGLRTMTPMAVLCWFAWLGNLPVSGTWAFWVANPVTTLIFTALALCELLGDKHPKMVDRISLGPLLARITFGGLVGALAATGLSGSAVEGTILGAISAIAGAFLGFHLRHWMVHTQGFRDFAVALVEDAIAIGFAILALGIVTG
ncbi:DUF4126 family protein [Granulicella sp. WH15]|uniref:DUF4126 family protein n=1 Tax=Granulicella sp. WH15 TaxID=2602070 RepID=UPI0013677F95|nr:DUF4126 family protein [Granulicella sp. WH15]QHN01969.1 DUF4126 family protein [Granulicella sp. WH15]